jgi:hypothetical protein
MFNNGKLVFVFVLMGHVTHIVGFLFLVWKIFGVLQFLHKFIVQSIFSEDQCQVKCYLAYYILVLDVTNDTSVCLFQVTWR